MSQTPSASMRRGRRSAGETSWTWEELGDIIVSFGYSIRGNERRLQTKAYHSQEAMERIWDGVAQGDLFAWIIDRARLFLPEEERLLLKASPAEGRPGGAPLPLEVALESLRLHQPETTAEPGTDAAAQLMASGTIRLRGAEHSAAGREHSVVQVDLFLVRMDTEARCAIGTVSGELDPGTYETSFQKHFPAPAIGRYRLEAVVTVPAFDSLTATFGGPILRVEPNDSRPSPLVGLPQVP